MTIDERESHIQQLVLETGYNRSAFDKMDDTTLLKELARYYG